MNYPTLDIGSLDGIPSSKRRYSSTAVGFPIRNDQKPHSQRVSEDFPSWARTRAPRIYVHMRPNCHQSSSTRLTNDQTVRNYLPTKLADTPNERPKNHPTNPLQHPHNTSFAPYIPPAIDPRSTAQTPSIHPPSVYGSLAVRLRFTWESLDPSRNTFTTHSIHFPGSFKIH